MATSALWGLLLYLHYVQVCASCSSHKHMAPKDFVLSTSTETLFLNEVIFVGEGGLGLNTSL